MERNIKKYLIELSMTQRQMNGKSTRIGTPITIINFTKTKTKVFEFKNIDLAGNFICNNPRYNYLHTKFTIAKKQGKKILHIPNSTIGEVFVIKTKDKKLYPSLFN